MFVPDDPTGVYPHIHGGGWVLGTVDYMDPGHEQPVEATGMAVVSVDYRLAPEHPYPGPDDCEAAALWVIENAEYEFGSSRLTIGGESAGAHLAAVSLVRLRDKHAFTGFLAANLVYGANDLDGSPSSRNWRPRNLILDTPTMQWFADRFAPARIRRKPDVSPLYAVLHDLPPTLFSVGTLDPLLDDSLFMEIRWRVAGCRAELAICLGGAHAFDVFSTTMARKARSRMFEFLARSVPRHT